MTLTEVKSIYNLPSTTKESPDKAAGCATSPIEYCWPDRGPYIVIDPIEIGDIKMEVTVQAGYKSTKVVGVRLADHTLGIGGNGVRDFNALRTLLIQKYGATVNQETKIDDIGAHVTTALWTFPSTAILLSLREQTMIYVEYTATNKKALDVL